MTPLCKVRVYRRRLEWNMTKIIYAFCIVQNFYNEYVFLSYSVRASKLPVVKNIVLRERQSHEPRYFSF